MANSIGLAEEYTAELDVVYAKESLTSNLEVDNAMVRGFDNAGTVHLPDIVTDGLGDYDRDNGFSRGSTTLTWSPYTIDFDRAQEFQIDNLDDQESQNVAFAGTSTEFVRTQVVPEVDATRFAVMHTAANTKVEADLADGDAVLTAWDTAMLTMDNDEVGRETRLSYMSYDNLSKLKNASSIEREFQTQMINGMEVNREIWKLDGVSIIGVPSARFYTEITLDDGTGGGGYAKTAVTGRDLNFLLIDTRATNAITRHNPIRIFDPATNQDADAWKYQYRLYHDLIVPKNKVKGVYSHRKTT